MVRETAFNEFAIVIRLLNRTRSNQEGEYMANTHADDRSSAWSVFLIFLRLGLTSFGGPIAHLGYFRDEFVTRRRWLTERSYADLVALCQFLPGPASSQVGIALGVSRAGYRGALAAWAGFTLPSAVALILFALGISQYGTALSPGALHGLKVVAVAVVAQAVWGMARTLCTDVLRVSIMVMAACVALLEPSAWGQVSVIAAAGLAGLLLFKPDQSAEHDPLPITISPRIGVIWLSLFLALLIGLPLLTQLLPNQTVAMVDAFYRSGSLVFGGGHVVLPLLQAGGAFRLGQQRNLPGRVWRRAGCTRPLVHVRRVPRRVDEPRPVGLDRRHVLLAGDLHAVLSFDRGSLAFLGTVAPQFAHTGRTGRRKCSGDRPAVGRAVSACLDQCHFQAARLRPGPDRPGCADVLENPAVAGGCRLRGRGVAVERHVLSNEK